MIPAPAKLSMEEIDKIVRKLTCNGYRIEIRGVDFQVRLVFGKDNEIHVAKAGTLQDMLAECVNRAQERDEEWRKFHQSEGRT